MTYHANKLTDKTPPRETQSTLKCLRNAELTTLTLWVGRVVSASASSLIIALRVRRLLTPSPLLNTI